MLSLAKAAKDYYLQKLGEVSPREDYYLRGGLATGMWRGSGAAELGLGGAVSAEGLVRLFDGEHPGTGEQLGRRLRRDGVAAWDLTFSADKSVSLLWALSDEDTRRQVVEAFDEATMEASELFNLFETGGSLFHWVGVSSSGLLIHAVWGSGGGVGGLRTNRLGCVW